LNQQEWYTRGLDAAWRQFSNQDIFQLACNVVLEEASSVRTQPVSIEVNAMQNQFREGIFSAVRSLRALAQARPEGPIKKLHKPWEREEEKEELPPGPQRSNNQ
jgi:hypothetical protein